MNTASVSNEEPTTKLHTPNERAQQAHPLKAHQQPSATPSSDKALSATQQTTTLSTSALPSRLPKLDGVLYHFYSKTLAVITDCRLTHYDALDSPSSSSVPAAPHVESPTNTVRSSSSGTSSNLRIVNKWFDLEIADYDIFREEVRLWRNISGMIPSAIFEGPTSASGLEGQSTIPPMIIDVILDTSMLTEKHLIMMDRSDKRGSTSKRRVRVDGNEWVTGVGKGEERMRDTLRKPIVLETWKLELNAYNPPDPPDLPTLYRHATANLKELHSLVRQLPVYPMYARLKRLKEALKQGEDNEADLLKIGVRLGIEAEKQEDDICSLQESLGPVPALNSALATKVTETFSFQPLETPIGTIAFSVEYRIEADFFVEILESSKNLQDLDLEEDYFRPGINRQGARQDVNEAVGLISSSSSSSSTAQSKPGSSLPTISDRRQGIIAAESSSSNAAAGQSNAQSSPQDMGTRSPVILSAASTSVFSASASSGKPVAGLSSLRRSPSITTAGHGTSPTTTMTPTGGSGSNSAATSVLISDAAFLTQGRRGSMSERKLRTLNNMSGSGGDRSSPTINAAATFTPSSPQIAGRPILARATNNVLPSLRTGSFSPSSPSPLAQQLSAQQQINVPPSTSNVRTTSSPSYRIASLPFSASPSLRSVFQTYPLSQSQTSISSLSKTPPKSITEGMRNTPSLGLHGTSASQLEVQHSPSQSGLSGERQQPSVAPQMIKRYSSTFNYRQGRQSASALSGAGASGESSIESDGNAGPYSKSWQTRIEQRQMMTARSLGREEGSHFSSSSGGHFFNSNYSPRAQRRSIGASTSQEDDLDDFVRMIDSNHLGETPSSVGSTSHSGAISLEEGGGPKRSSPSRFSSATATSSGIAFHRHFNMNRNQVDDMLSKMQSCVREFSISMTRRGSGGASGSVEAGGSGSGVVIGSFSSGSNRSHGVGAGGGAGSDGSPQSSQGVPISNSPSFARSPLSRVGFSAANNAAATTDAIKSASAPTYYNARRSLKVEKQAPYRYNLPTRRDFSSQVDEAAKTTAFAVKGEGGKGGKVAEQEERKGEGDGEGEEEDSASADAAGRYANHGHSYDPLEDEAVGRFELVQDDLLIEQGSTSRRMTGALSPTHQGLGGHHHHHHHHLHHKTNDAALSEAAERRRVDSELARNFGQVVSSSSSRGNARASLSPWRNRLPNQTNATAFGNRGGNGTS
ncbi:hypothetical protein CBS101457_004409 [Exobasidium rhododendri]|nr:hypothetical protein CBS101457_004409 [Exobasidium rhododendri]